MQDFFIGEMKSLEKKNIPEVCMHLRQEGLQGQWHPAEVALKQGRTFFHLSSCVSSEKSASGTSGNFYTTGDFQSDKCQCTGHISRFFL